MKQQFNCRFEKETLELLKRLSKELKLTQSKVLEIGLDLVNKQYKAK